MISESTLNAISPIQELLYADRVTVATMPRSVLATIMASSKSAAFSMPNDSKDSFIDAWLADMTLDPLGNKDPVECDGVTHVPMSLHSRTMDEAAQAVFSCTLDAIKFVSGKVIPDIRKLIDKVDASVNDAYRPVEEWEIYEGSFLPVWETKIVKHIMSRASAGDGILPALRVNSDYPMVMLPDGTSLYEHMSSGSKELDKTFREALNSVGMDINALFMTVFGPVGTVGPIRHTIEMRNLAMCQLLMIYMIEDNPWEGTGLSSSSWSKMCATLKSALTKTVAIYKSTSELNKKSNMMIVDIDYKKHRIYVESDVYNDWLDENQANSPERLIGLAMLNESTVFTAESATTKGAMAERAWASYHASKQQAIESNRLSIMRSSILSEIAAYLHDVSADDLPPGINRSMIVDKVTERMRGATLATISNLAELIIDIVSNDIYGHTGCYNLASRFNQVMVEEPNLSVEDAELKVVIEYITDFCSAQLVVGKM
ncbi:MAG: hypothetical protein ACRDDY_14180 [Clostridium sp.]|uniref:hypothetical protein n=1 Tax=Clostridium sp. TaxID=1506 RepID=UPI003EE5FF5F